MVNDARGHELLALLLAKAGKRIVFFAIEPPRAGEKVFQDGYTTRGANQ